MNKSWYKKTMPKVSDIKKIIGKIGEKIQNIDNVTDIYIWGSYLKNFKNNDFRVRNLDIITVANIDSQDLIAITGDDVELLFKTPAEDLEIDGYNPIAVNFTKLLLSIQDTNLNNWVIANDNKILHWGALAENEHEWQDIIEKTENYVSKISGIHRAKINKNKKSAETWYELFKEKLEQEFNDIPLGWYIVSNNPKKIISMAKNILKGD